MTAHRPILIMVLRAAIVAARRPIPIMVLPAAIVAARRPIPIMVLQAAIVAARRAMPIMDPNRAVITRHPAIIAHHRAIIPKDLSIMVRRLVIIPKDPSIMVRHPAITPKTNNIMAPRPATERVEGSSGTRSSAAALRSCGGRPSREVAALLRDKILDVATELFLRDGYAAVSIEMIARGARVSKRTFYQRFSNKAVVFTDV